jgi:hypothetical protein
MRTPSATATRAVKTAASHGNRLSLAFDLLREIADRARAGNGQATTVRDEFAEQPNSRAGGSTDEQPA